jgi:hypothetical protein
MKKSMVIAVLLTLLFQVLNAQYSMRPLTGNGKMTQTTQTLKPFQQLDILWLDGTIDVEFGAAQSDMTISTDEDIRKLLVIDNTEGKLRLEIKNNERNRLWLEDDRTVIKIRTTAQPNAIAYKANANATLRGIDCAYLQLDKDMNGDVTLIGKAATFKVEKADNGSVKAEKLITEKTTARKSGNGDLVVNARDLVKEKNTGNGGLYNIAVETKPEAPKVKRVNITFYNPKAVSQSYYVTGYNERGGRFSYGLGLGALQKQSEYLPTGTQVFRKGKLLATLKASDAGQVVRL